MNDIVKLALASVDEDTKYDQPCHYGLRVGNHAVYCENEKMSCRKCKRSWYTCGEERDEDCEGFKINRRCEKK